MPNQDPPPYDRELELEKVRVDAHLRMETIRADVRKVVYGTLIVGVAAAFFPFAQEFASAWFAERTEVIRTRGEYDRLREANRLAQELEQRKHDLALLQQSAAGTEARRSYLEQMASEARSSEIGKRIILAEFFSYLGEEGMRQQWREWRDYLVSQQREFNTERQLLQATAIDPNAPEVERTNALRRIQQIERLEDPHRDAAPNYDLPMPALGAGEGQLARRMLEIAVSEANYGIHQGSQASRVGEYLGSVGLRHPVTSGLPWSAAFVSWVIHQTGNPHQLALSASHITTWRSASSKGLSIRAGEQHPLPGDIAFIARQVEDVAEWHDEGGFLPGMAGFVYSVSEDHIKVIGGSTSNAVRLSTWRLDDPRLVGFIRLPDPPENLEPAASTAEVGSQMDEREQTSQEGIRRLDQ